ncbi:putative TOM core complex subunit Tom6 [Tricharina praecox]|uniref:putative TOM core complex subunit Tom6 n=1 Tax=Tricharina praecox TaxID=43433 RepID=UPI0022204AA7|nr:putative TOM core complex subunit Tom6 [Tricharina praecox]KAI5858820.1 putative TOM core complex subunit Tom6 [Tricharina praecox]
MAPQNRISSGGRSSQQPGMVTSLYRELRSPENAGLVKSVALFAVAITFFQSSWSEFLVPGF